jgi:hypothetical protein
MHREMNLAKRALDNSKGEREAGDRIDALLHDDGADMQSVLD